MKSTKTKQPLNILIVTIIVAIIVFPNFSIFQLNTTIAQETEIITINSDRASYHPRDTVLLVVSGNQFDEGNVHIYFDGSIIQSYSFMNLSGVPFQALWTIEAHATNGTYSAVAIYNNIDINATIEFDVIREGLVVPIELFRGLQLNVTFLYEHTKLKNWDLTVTNMWTKEEIEYDEIEKEFLISLDDGFDSLVFYKPGNAIELSGETLDGKYIGSIIFAASDGMNGITIIADKIRDPDYIVNFLFVGLVVAAVLYGLRHINQNIKRGRKEMETSHDPHAIPDIEI